MAVFWSTHHGQVVLFCCDCYSISGPHLSTLKLQSFIVHFYSTLVIEPVCKEKEKLKWGCFHPLLTCFSNSIKICYIFTYIKLALIVVSDKPNWGSGYSIKNPVFWLSHEVMCHMPFSPNLLASVDVFGLIGQSAAQWATVWAEPSVSVAWL